VLTADQLRILARHRHVPCQPPFREELYRGAGDLVVSAGNGVNPEGGVTIKGFLKDGADLLQGLVEAPLLKP
jgi:hypothetical protein